MLLAGVLLRLFSLAAESEEEAHGWMYFCYSGAESFQATSKNYHFQPLPEPESMEAAVTAAAAEDLAPLPGAADADANVDEPAATAPAVDDGAARLHGMQGTCFFMRVGYWTYEVCPFKRVRQYHSETRADGGAAIHSEFSLGTYDESKDEWQPGSTLYLQYFLGGAEGRTATARIICPENKREEDGIVIVHEPKEKQYVITVRIAALCAPARAGAGTPKPSPRPSPKPLSPLAKAAAVKAAQAQRATAQPSGFAAPLAEIPLPQARLLSPIRGRCFQITKDYWTYEFCPMKHVRQFHQEAHRITSEFSLGKYDQQAETRLTLPTGAKLPRGLVPHVFAGAYTNGTGNRATDIRVRCAQKNEHTVLSVEEPKVHSYVLEFSTPLACELNCAFSYHTKEPPGDEQQPLGGD